MVPSHILFDLDGTLVDTMSDLNQALNRTLEEHGRPHLAAETLRPLISMGSEAMILAGFGITPENRSFHAIRDRFFELYSSCSMEDSQLFPGIEQLLNALDARRLPWGIVTNKVARLTFPLLKQLDLLTRAACVVCGDTTAFQKPHPAPLLHACEQLPCEPGKAWYVGDARRDVDAGHAAGMFTVAALYGYWGNEEPPQAWGADALIEKPADLLELLP